MRYRVDPISYDVSNIYRVSGAYHNPSRVHTYIPIHTQSVTKTYYATRNLPSSGRIKREKEKKCIL